MNDTPPPLLSLLDKYHGTEPLALNTARVRVRGGEVGAGHSAGTITSEDGAFNEALRLPQALGGPGGGTNPEQLLAAGYASSLHGVIVLVAAHAGLAISDLTIEASVTIARDPVDGLFQLSAEAKVEIPGMDPRRTAALVRQAERVCPYSKMFRQGITHSVPSG